MQRGGEEKKNGGGGGQGYFRLATGGLNFFITTFRGVSSLIARYILRGVHWPRWVKNMCETVMLNCTILC